MTEIHTVTRKEARGWVVKIDDENRIGKYHAGYGYYLNRLCDGSTKPQPSFFAAREDARDAIDRYNELNFGVYKLVGGLH